MSDKKFPPLPLKKWKETRDTLHKYCKMVGTIREKMSKPEPHWWHISLRINDVGLTTLPLLISENEPDKTFEITIDLLNGRLLINSSYSEKMKIALTGQSLSALCDETCSLLSDIDIEPPIEKPSFINGKPGKFEITDLKNYWTVLQSINDVFLKFKSKLQGQSSPVQLWPHHFDLALSWFSGRLVPGKDPKNPEESQEQMTFGFSTGDESIADAYFYATAYPTQESLPDLTLTEDAYWNKQGFTGVVLKYSSLIYAKIHLKNF